MAKRTYSVSFKDGACQLVLSEGYSAATAAKKLGVPEMTLRAWLNKRDWRGPVQSRLPAACDDPKILCAQIRDLTERLHQAEMEREILKKATAFFASQS